VAVNTWSRAACSSAPACLAMMARSSDASRSRLVKLTAKRYGGNSVAMLESVLTCPACGRQTTETMPTNACHVFYTCPHCQTVLRPLAGDCCVYCSYGSVPCPPIQEERLSS